VEEIGFLNLKHISGRSSFKPQNCVLFYYGDDVQQKAAVADERGASAKQRSDTGSGAGFVSDTPLTKYICFGGYIILAYNSTRINSVGSLVEYRWQG
jgi:hypothetical protein